MRTREEVHGRRSFTGTIAAADEQAVEVTLPEGAISIPHERIRRSNLIPEVDTR